MNSLTIFPSHMATTLLQFGSLRPVQVCLGIERSRDKCERNFDPNAQEDEEWILVTKRRKGRRSPTQNKHLLCRQLQKIWLPRRQYSMVHSKTSLKKDDQNAQRGHMPITLGEYFPKGFLKEDQIENINMTSSIEIEDKDVTKEVEVLAKPTKDNGSSVELDLFSLE
ncbi:hypothetical protein ACH5RR_008403 [Cinchona calisaya]|uniref:Uncharacterized protein n=1 Tax=Cinchona calisaya TaxID=153742 RepID=A0ABD3ABA0_9GENT